MKLFWKIRSGHLEAKKKNPIILKYTIQEIPGNTFIRICSDDIVYQCIKGILPAPTNKKKINGPVFISIYGIFPVVHGAINPAENKTVHNKIHSI